MYAVKVLSTKCNVCSRSDRQSRTILIAVLDLRLLRWRLLNTRQSITGSLLRSSRGRILARLSSRGASRVTGHGVDLSAEALDTAFHSDFGAFYPISIWLAVAIEIMNVPGPINSASLEYSILGVLVVRIPIRSFIVSLVLWLSMIAYLGIGLVVPLYGHGDVGL